MLACVAWRFYWGETPTNKQQSHDNEERPGKEKKEKIAIQAVFHISPPQASGSFTACLRAFHPNKTAKIRRLFIADHVI